MQKIRRGPSGRRLELIPPSDTPTLEEVLQEGNRTGDIPILLSAGSYITSEEGVQLTLVGLLGLLLQSYGALNITTLEGGEIRIQAGGSDGSQAPLELLTAARPGVGAFTGTINVKTGDAESGQSGAVGVLSGDGETTGVATLASGDTENGVSGDAFVSSGNATGSGNSGAVNVTSGSAESGNSGHVYVASGPSSSGTRGNAAISGANVILQPGNATYLLPTEDGTPGQVLSTDGSGILSWIDP